MNSNAPANPVFSKSPEFKIVNIVGIIGLVLVLISATDFIKIPILNDKQLIAILVNFALFNTLHVVLSFYLIFKMSGTREWLKRKKSIFGKFHWEFGIAFLVFFLISLFGSQIGSREPFKTNFGNTNSLVFYYIVFILLSTFHGVGQEWGIISILNHERGESRNFRVFNKINFEKIVYKVIPVLLTFVGFLIAIKHFKNPPSNLVTSLATFIGIIFVLIFFTLLLLATFQERRIFGPKFLFLLRGLIKPFFFYSPFSILISQANHGVENMCINYRLIKSSGLNIRKIYLPIMALFAIWTVVSAGRYFDTGLGNNTVFIVLMSFLTAIDLTHYWLERLIYRFRDKESFELVRPYMR